MIEEDGLGGNWGKGKGVFTTTLTLAVIASAPVDFVENVLHIQHALES
jgi:hypothetical protein